VSFLLVGSTVFAVGSTVFTVGFQGFSRPGKFLRWRPRAPFGPCTAWPRALTIDQCGTAPQLRTPLPLPFPLLLRSPRLQSVPTDQPWQVLCELLGIAVLANCLFVHELISVSGPAAPGPRLATHNLQSLYHIYILPLSKVVLPDPLDVLASPDRGVDVPYVRPSMLHNVSRFAARPCVTLPLHDGSANTSGQMIYVLCCDRQCIHFRTTCN